MDEYKVVSIPISDGTEREFAIIDKFDVRRKKYIAVALIEGDEIKEGIYIYRYQKAEDGDIIVEEIPDIEEYDKVSAVYRKMIEE